MTTAPTCTRCGESIGPADRFCPRCGADVSGVQASIATAVVHQHAPPAPAALQAAQLDAVRQATLGEYEILGELGRGGMATVYLAHDIALDRQVAIKVMAPALLAGEGMAERFKREARTAASLSHPNIIPIYAVRETEQTLYFVMKLIEGRPLDSIIHEIGPLPIPMVQAIVHQVGSALGYAHKRGVVHRDVKAANVMVDSDGWAVVTDFGIAKVAEAHGLTVTGATVGTPSYMSPEQCGAKDLTGASDQYSLGVVAYEMLTGRLPFTAVSVMAIMYAHFHQPPPPITNVRPDVPADLAAAVMRMLEKEPEQRWPNMEAAVAAVAAGTATVTATIENTSATATVTVTPAEARRRRAGAIAAGVVLVGVAGALVWLKPWAPSVTLAPSRLVRLVTESAQVQVPAPVPPPATPETTAGRPPAVKQTAAPRRNPRPAPPRAAVSNSSAVAIVPRHDTTPAVTPPVTPPVAQNPGPAPIPAAPAPPPPPPPPHPRPPPAAATAPYAPAPRPPPPPAGT